MNRQFVIVLTLFLYQALLTIRGPIEYYGNIILQNSAVMYNSELMVNMVICSIVGIVLTIFTNRYLRNKTAVISSEILSDVPSRGASR